MVLRREYSVSITVNSRRITKVVVDPHYEEKHASTINDALILGLVHQLDNNSYPVSAKDEEFEYFVVDKVNNLRLKAEACN